MGKTINIYKNFEAITQVAIHFAKKDKCNYNIVINNPVNGEFDFAESTYEFVRDGYLPSIPATTIVITKTDDLLKEK
jgi:hypothetical protein